MWLYHFTMRHKALIYSIYLIFLFIGLLTLWRWGQQVSSDHDYLLFRPLLLSFLLVLVIIKLMKSMYYTAFVALHMLSVIIITMVFIELSELHLSLTELVGASIYLIAVSSVIVLYIFEYHRGLVIAVGKAVLYSTSFFILLLIISKLFMPLGALQSSVLLVVIVGQLIAYVVSLLLLPLLSYFISQKEMTMVQVDEEQKIGNINSFFIFVVVFTILVSMVYIAQINIDYSFVVIWFFSIFLSAAIYNCFRKALSIHLLLLLFIPSLVISMLLSGYFEQGIFLAHSDSLNRELLLGLLFTWGFGLLPILTWVDVRYQNRRLYSLSLVLYVVALFPLVLGLGEEIGLKWVTFMMIVGYSIVNSVSPIYYRVLEAMIYREKKRADRPFRGLKGYDDEIHSYPTGQTFISEEDRERALTIVYGKWLQKREQHLEQKSKL